MLAQMSFKPVGKIFNKFNDPQLFANPDNFIHIGLKFTYGDVINNISGKQIDILRYDRDNIPETVSVDILQVNISDTYFSLIQRIELLKYINDGCFSGSTFTHESSNAAFGNSEGQVIEHVDSGAISKLHMFKFDVSNLFRL